MDEKRLLELNLVTQTLMLAERLRQTDKEKGTTSFEDYTDKAIRLIKEKENKVLIELRLRT